MQELVLELSVGDVVVIGDRTFTVIDIDGDEVSFRIDDAEAANAAQASDARQNLPRCK